MRVSLGLLMVLIGVVFAPSSGAATTQPLPSESSFQHLGVASCAGTTCHGATQPLKGSNVLQNEFLVWERQDPHSKAYKSLTSEAGKRIAANLGLKSSTDAECLACHSDPATPAAQGKRWKASEGVTCEACHGGAEKWLGPHITGTVKYSENVSIGLYPLADPPARARLCLSCHAGTDASPLTHKLMGAGHPPVNGFELDTYTATQPAHYRVDADYRQRKPVSSGAKTWTTGQVFQATHVLDGLTGSRFAMHGLVPELAFFDCDSCHHAMQPPRWNPGLAGSLGPGELRIDDAALSMTAQIVAVLAPAESAQWNEHLDALRNAPGKSVDAIKDAAGALKTQLAGLSASLIEGEPSPAQVKQIAERVAKDGLDRGAGSYALAQQTTQAIAALTDDLPQPPASLKSSVDALFKTSAKREAYDANAYRAALKGALAAVQQVK